ncbi:MAG TPA: hypothetical protein VHD32_13525 [Candidatus Didemnitutus sp.]|nr:hypothetical protein [Candidatus Didemnitutus sp.]
MKANNRFGGGEEMIPKVLNETHLSLVRQENGKLTPEFYHAGACLRHVIPATPEELIEALQYLLAHHDNDPKKSRVVSF